MLFTQAGLKSPATLSFWNDSSDKSTVESIEIKIKSMNLRKGNCILAKPNAGGFGAGIKQTTLPLQDHDISAFEDSITLLQKFEQPLNNKLYRVWFLRGKVQCAVERDIQDETSQFRSACSGSCSLQRPPKVWNLPFDVRQELERELLPLLPDAHCGSVEFLYSLNSERLYFDLNLLSTLPINVLNEGDIWKEGYDPWKELAEACLQILYRQK